MKKIVLEDGKEVEQIQQIVDEAKVMIGMQNSLHVVRMLGVSSFSILKPYTPSPQTPGPPLIARAFKIPKAFSTVVPCIKKRGISIFVAAPGV